MEACASSALPFLVASHDAIRQGLHSLKEETKVRHPVEVIQAQHAAQTDTQKMAMLRDLYGIAVPAKLQIEAQILGRVGRMPGMPSSKLGLEAMNGTLEDFTFESYLGQSEMSESVPVELHAQMEKRLNMGTAVVARGIL